VDRLQREELFGRRRAWLSNSDGSSGRRNVNDVLQAALELQGYCQKQKWRFCFIGGVAVMRWGEPRETIDADLTLLAGFGKEREFIDPLLSRFDGRIPDAGAFAEEHRVLLLRSSAGVGLDISLSGLPYEELVVTRSSPFAYAEQITLQTCSAEDLIILKAFAARSQDWADVERIIVRQAGRLDWPYIDQNLTPLVELKEQPEILYQLEARRAEFEKE
jgi:hypothetical protein